MLSQKSSLTLPIPDRPLRPIFIHPATTYPPSLPSSSTTSQDSSHTAAFIPIICLSASTFIPHGGPEPIRDAWGTFEYIQGSGDDDELWGKGLKPPKYFANLDKIMAAPRDELDDVISSILLQDSQDIGVAFEQPNGSRETHGAPGWSEAVEHSGLWLGTNSSSLPDDMDKYKVITFIKSDQPSARHLITVGSQDTTDSPEKAQEVVFSLQDGKKKKSDLDFVTQVLPVVTRFADCARQQGRQLLIRDWDGKNFSIGAAVCLLWNHQGQADTSAKSKTRE